ncbi:MAG: hypothetical protein U0Y82_17000 [Thermoleophilia bacterium]
MSETQAADQATPPDCERCGTRTFASSRVMRTHDIINNKAIPRDQAHPVWRCPACGRETPRTAEASA